MHARRRLREAFESILVGANVASGRVYTGRTTLRSTLPHVDIYTPTEQAERLSTDALGREVTVTVRGYVEGAAPDDALDDLAEDIESAINLAALRAVLRVMQVTLSATDSDVSGEGETPLGIVEMRYTVMLITPPDDPATLK